MKLLGRILLLLVGAALIAFAVPRIIDVVNVINAVDGWGILFTEETLRPQLVTLITQGANALFGAFAILGFLFAKGRGLLIFFSLLMLGEVIWFLITAIQGGAITDWKNSFQIVMGFVLPVAYFAGAFLLKKE